MHRTRPFVALLGVALLLASSACKTSNALVLGLQAAVDAASVAISVVSAGDPGATLALTYAQNVSQAATQAITEFRSSDTNAAKIEKITAYFVAVPAPNLAPGTQRIIIVSVNAITNAVEIFLTQLKATQTVVNAHGITAQQQTAMLTKMTLSDRSMLSSVMGKAKQNLVAAQAKK